MDKTTIATCTLGIIGGGQLARMLAQSATQLGCKIVILEKAADSPASQVASKTILGDWDDAKSLIKLAEACDVITLENEFVKASALAGLEESGKAPLFPSSRTMAVVQDKLLQKQALAAAGLPLPRFMAVASRADIERAGKEFGWPLVLKKRCNGYDGKGNFTLRTEAEISIGWDTLDGNKNALYVEEFCPFKSELAIMVTRGRDGQMVSYPLVETVQEEHICRTVVVPAPILEAAPNIAEQAKQIALKAVEQVGMVGSMGVEMFLRRDDTLCINELAPRVHNSGHYTIEACECSQFENHIRAVLGWPLGSTSMRVPSACMVNLLGEGNGSGSPHGLAGALSIPGVHAHIYGKVASLKGRKMGHVTVIGSHPVETLEKALKASKHLRFGN